MGEPPFKKQRSSENKIDDSALSCFFQTIHQGMLILATGVNKKWREIALQPKFWTKIDIAAINSDYDAVWKNNKLGIRLPVLVKRLSRTLEVLVISPSNFSVGSIMFDDFHQQKIIFPKLTAMIFVGPYALPYNLLHGFLSECCPALTKCNFLFGSSSTYTAPTDLDPFLSFLGSAHPNKLTHFSLGYANPVRRSSNSLENPVEPFSKSFDSWAKFHSVTHLILQNLSLDGTLFCNVLSDMECLKHITVTNLQITGTLRRLDLPVEELHISCTDKGGQIAISLINSKLKRLYISVVKFDVFAHLAQTTPNLEVLSITQKNFNFTGESLACFTLCCPQVIELQMNAHNREAAENLTHLQNLPKLQKLDLQVGPNNSILWQICKLCKQVQELAVASCGQVQEVKSTVRYEVFEGEFANLRKLILRGFSVKWPIFAILKGASEITHLTLTDHFGDSPMQLALPKLQKIVIREQKPEVMIELLRAAPNLFSLELQLWTSVHNIELVVDAIINHKNLGVLILNCWKTTLPVSQDFFQYFNQHHARLFKGTNINVIFTFE